MAANMSSFTSRKSSSVVRPGVGVGFCHPAYLGLPLPTGFASPIVTFFGRRNWFIFCGLNRGQSLAKCEPQ